VPKRFTLGKKERLKSRKLIEELFTEGKNFLISPFRIHYLIKKEDQALSEQSLLFGVAVSAKNFKKAVDRNRIKRLIREAYRLQKLPLQEKVKEKKIQLSVFFNFTGKELPDFQIVKEKVDVALKRLSGSINENDPSGT
jgi:ribonuclease P protein component